MAIGVSQQTISTIENSEAVDEEKLQQIAEALGVSSGAIKSFNDENLITYRNTFNDQSMGLNTDCTFNPLDKLMQSHDENKQLYERLLQAEKDKLAYAEKLLENK